MEVVLAFLSGQDVLVTVPTGEGKSLCNAVLPWTSKEGSTVVVVFSLVTLMKEQVSKCRSKGLTTLCQFRPDT